MQAAVSPSRRRLFSVLAGVVLATTSVRLSRAAPVTRILVGFAPGGGVDRIARVLAQQMQRSLGEIVVVENRPGAGGLLAAQAVLTAAADGHTLLLSNDHALAIVPHQVPGAGYRSPDDFRAVAQLTDKAALALAVRADSPVRELADLPALPGSPAVGVPAPGSVPAYVMEMVGERLEVDLVVVPYRGGAPMVTELLGGHLAMGMTSVAEVLEPWRAGSLRVLAVTGRRRHPDLPQVPTFGEQGLAGLEHGSVVGLFAPPGTDAGRVAVLRQAVFQALQDEDVRQQLRLQGSQVNPADGEVLARNMREIHQRWALRARLSASP